MTRKRDPHEVARFTAHTNPDTSPPGWVYVVVYDDVAALRAAAHRFHPEEHRFADAAAVFQGTACSFVVNDKGEVTSRAPHYAGVMRLLTTSHGGVVAHESMHAALRIYLGQRGEIDLIDMEQEEEACYAMSDLLDQITDVYHRLGLWS